MISKHDPVAARRAHAVAEIGASSVTPHPDRTFGPDRGPSTHFIAQVFFLFPTGSEPADFAFDADDHRPLPAVIVRAPASTSVRAFIELALTRLAADAASAADVSLPGHAAAVGLGGGGARSAIASKKSSDPHGVLERARGLAAIDPPSAFLEDFSLHLARPDGTGIRNPAPEDGDDEGDEWGAQQRIAATVSINEDGAHRRKFSSTAGPSRPRLPPSPFSQPSQIVLQTPSVSFPYQFVVASLGVDYSAITAAASRGARAVMAGNALDPAMCLVQPGRTRLACLVTLKETARARAAKISAIAAGRPLSGSGAAPRRASVIAPASAGATPPPALVPLSGASAAATSSAPGSRGAPRGGAASSSAVTSPTSRSAAAGVSFVGAPPRTASFSTTSVRSGRVSRSHAADLFVADAASVMAAMGLTALDLAKFGEGAEAAQGAQHCAQTGPALEQVEVERRRAEANATKERARLSADVNRAADCRRIVKSLAEERQIAEREAARRAARSTLDIVREQADVETAAAQRRYDAQVAEARLRAEERAGAAATLEQLARAHAERQRALDEEAAQRAAAAMQKLSSAIANKEKERDLKLHPVRTFAGPLTAALHAAVENARGATDEAAHRQSVALSRLQAALEADCQREREAAGVAAVAGMAQRHEAATLQNQTDAVKEAEARRAGAKRIERAARRDEAGRLAELHRRRVEGQASTS